MRFIPASLLVLACLASEAATRSTPPHPAAEATVATPLTNPPGTVPAMTRNVGGNGYAMPQYDNNGYGMRATAPATAPQNSPTGTMAALAGNRGGNGYNSYAMPQYDNNGYGQQYYYGYQQPYYYAYQQPYYHGYQQPYYYTYQQPYYSYPYASYGYNYGSYYGKK